MLSAIEPRLVSSSRPKWMTRVEPSILASKLTGAGQSNAMRPKCACSPARVLTASAASAAASGAAARTARLSAAQSRFIITSILEEPARWRTGLFQIREDCVDVVLLVGFLRQRRPVEQRAVVIWSRRGLWGRRRSDLGLVAECREQRIDLFLDVLQRAHHLGDALPGHVLEI